MDQPPPPPPDRPIGHSLRHKLLTLWLGSILGVLLLVGLVLTTLTNDFSRSESRRDLGLAISHIRSELLILASGLSTQAELLAPNAQVVATINMVHRYQDVTDYQPLVFDAEKRSLAAMLAERLGSSGLSFAAIYDGHGRLAAWAQAGEAGPAQGVHTVIDGMETMLIRSESDWRPAHPPALMRAGGWDATARQPDVTYRVSSGRVVLETVAPITRELPGAAAMTVGYVHLARSIDQTVVERLDQRVGARVAFTANGSQIGTLPPLAVPEGDIPSLQSQSESQCPCVWLEVNDMEVAVAAIDLDSDGHAVVMAGLSNSAVAEVLRVYQISALLVLLAVAVVVGPAGLVLLNATIVRPLSRLLNGAEALKLGHRIHLAEQFKDDELGRLAREFDDMADSIAEREDELHATIDQLAHSNAELERFAVVAAHDLQEPLRMVISYTQLLKRRYHGELDKDADTFIDFAVDGAERMRALIRDLLEYSKVDGDQAPYAPVDLGKVVADVLRLLADPARESGAVFDVGPLPVVHGNVVQLAQVFQNLLTNALKFRSGSPPLIVVRALRKEHEWEVSVADNGIGIAAEYLPQLFTLFRRLHTQQQYPGLGLGLAITRRIVERHGGRMWAESQEGVGTTMTFTLPA